MPRIRSLKPEHRTHRKVGKLADREYRLWTSMILEADDDGRLVCDADQLRVQTWPFHPRVTTAQVEAAIQAIAGVGLIRLYEVAGVRYAHFPSWKDHQHPKYPTPSKLPPRPVDEFPQRSPSPSPVTPESFSTRVVESRGVEISRDERRREERGSGRGGVELLAGRGAS